MLKFNVKSQRINWVNQYFLVVANSYEYLKAKFTFSLEWENSIKTAIFKKNTSTFYKILIDNECEVPWELLQNEGEFTVSVMAGNLITTNEVTIPVTASGYIQEGTPKPSSDVYVELINTLEEISDMVADTKTRYECLTDIFNDLIIDAGNSNAEIVAARIDKIGTSYATLGERLNAIQDIIETCSKKSDVLPLATQISQMQNNLSNFYESYTNACITNYTDELDIERSTVYENLKARLDEMTQLHYNLLGQVNNLILEASESVPELVNARTDANNKTYATLKARLDEMDNNRKNINDILVQPASSDLNNYTSTGTYYFNAQSHKNLPTNCVDGFLVVFANGDIVKQTFYRQGTIKSNDYETFIRTFSNEWSEWSTIVTSNNYTEVGYNFGTIKAGKTVEKSFPFTGTFTKDNSYIMSAMYQIGAGNRWRSEGYNDKWELNVSMTSTDGITASMTNNNSDAYSNVSVKILLFRVPTYFVG